MTQNRQNSLELYVRSLAPRTAIRPHLDRIQTLEALAADGLVSEYTIHVVGDGIIHEGDYEEVPIAQHLTERLAEIEAWTEEHDASVPGIRTTTVSETRFNDMEYTVTMVPHKMVLEYTGGQLRFCSPAVTDGQLFSVDEHLADIRTAAGYSDRSRVERNL
ncbi:HTH domain-containing protein [Halapricum desulfuricans]|uniref:Uncharacterized protein n=1 Tax=Halapricum desulfuricans TaxID=2841257 RepID=A0A897MZF3_9EURY|nr:HTH domain-containing protein [Halapricum desulfuricans]QSG05378.1 Uncharacterized protein HSR121_1031 [Halapricum desulfuricans]